MNAISHFNDIIDYIEENLTGDIDVAEMSRMAQMSVYEFRRVFSFAAGMSVSEYIRARRLSAAAEELGRASVTELALKYGYDTPSSFSRAFKEFHGVAPSAAGQGKAKMNRFTRISFDFRVTGGSMIRYEIIEDGGFYISGVTGLSDLNDTECCENVWNRFSFEDAQEPVYAAYFNSADGVECAIGARKEQEPEEGQYAFVPASRWVCFSMRGSDDEKVNAFYKNILLDFFQSGKLRKAERLPDLEVYPKDVEDEDFLWEIRIPIEA